MIHFRVSTESSSFGDCTTIQTGWGLAPPRRKGDVGVILVAQSYKVEELKVYGKSFHRDYLVV